MKLYKTRTPFTLFALPILFIILLSLSGCAAFQTIPPHVSIQHPIQHYSATVAPIEHWKCSGIIGIQYDGKGESARFNWIQKSPTNYHIQLLGTLNLGQINLSVTHSKTTLVDQHGKIFTDKSPEHLMQQKLGWFIPSQYLYFWMRALPFVNDQNNIPTILTSNAFRLPEQIQQLSWKIHYSQYQLWHTQKTDYPLPGKIIFSNNRLKLKITLVIHAWKVSNPS